MTKLSAALLLLGALLVVAGVAMWNIPAALVLAGVLTIAAGVLSLDWTPRTKARP